MFCGLSIAEFRSSSWPFSPLVTKNKMLQGITSNTKFTENVWFGFLIFFFIIIIRRTSKFPLQNSLQYFICQRSQPLLKTYFGLLTIDTCSSVVDGTCDDYLTPSSWTPMQNREGVARGRGNLPFFPFSLGFCRRCQQCSHFQAVIGKIYYYYRLISIGFLEHSTGKTIARTVWKFLFNWFTFGA